MCQHVLKWKEKHEPIAKMRTVSMTDAHSSQSAKYGGSNWKINTFSGLFDKWNRE